MFTIFFSFDIITLHGDNAMNQSCIWLIQSLNLIVLHLILHSYDRALNWTAVAFYSIYRSNQLNHVFIRLDKIPKTQAGVYFWYVDYTCVLTVKLRWATNIFFLEIIYLLSNEVWIKVNQFVLVAWRFDKLFWKGVVLCTNEIISVVWFTSYCANKLFYIHQLLYRLVILGWYVFYTKLYAYQNQHIINK